ncbi:flagellar biosynthetic protein FliR [Cupriavidus pampae]|uniref:Flagellar biosynthetic protein FliR n=1 Tax=Cupriavidus pampae TaxID=659251 RepID=A0ABN7ZMU4_9BURK|nr:flagellar biosynthetic protein FliR [Cupriavidus pampae]CAG9185467.1 Flagellar biosynthetic protein FliR [Cupriavidus pampae]
MLDVSTDQLYGWIAAFLWPMFRLLGLIAAAPLFSESSIPRRAKVGLAAALAAIVSPTLSNIPVVPAYSYEGLLIILNEVGIGIAMGFTMRLVFAAVQVAGEFTGLQMGLSFASFYDRNAGGQTMVVSRFLNLVAMLMFLAMDGHLTMLATVVDSFNGLPIAATPLSGHGWGALARAGSMVFAWGTLLSLPLIAALLTLNLALGILNRASPQLSVYAVGFPITLAGGMLVLMLVMPQLGAYMQHLIEAGLQTMNNILVQFAN